MTKIRVQTIEAKNGDEWRPEYQIGHFKDGDTTNYEKGNFYWKTVVWKVGDRQEFGNAWDRVLQSNGGHFDHYRYRFVEMDFDPEKHHMEPRQ